MIKPTNGIIAAGDRGTVNAGQMILDAGGNAFDAAIAAMLASFVVEPTLTSAGGGGFLLARTCQGENILFDFFSQTPRHKKSTEAIDFYPIEVNFGDAIQQFHIGLGAMAVPGAIAGAVRIHQSLGRLPFSVVAEPAIHYAEKGFQLSKFQDLCINQLLSPILLATAGSRQIFAPEGKLLQKGDTIYQKDLAATLQEIVKEGDRVFYQGEIARKIAADCQESGGHLTLADFHNYRVIVQRPLQFTYRQHTCLTNPPPSSGGTLIAFALELLSTLDIAQFPHYSSEHLRELATIMQLTNTARKDSYDDRLYQDNIAETFLHPNYLQPYQETLINKFGSTTHISVIDKEGNAASVTTSNGEGSSYVVPGTGIMLNNMLGEADLNPGGFHRWPGDRRLSSMMSPTIVLKEDKPYIVLGSGGSNRIRTAILQVISNLIDFEMSMSDAIASPRIHWEDNVLNIEPPYSSEISQNFHLDKDTKTVLWQEQSMFFGGVHGVIQNSFNEFAGAGDPRRQGVCNEV
ncbi:MAG: gamma-glutamyltransferase [Jaaginema sp. PMC 1079.18]|nr:gamma-glutamyltransferase [Jaaginema sp. PMC 1080.18]MEC4852489.1 gamma-glutamyltransferase [Jaaginema sp. PMC 1079.18]MEC4865510.1 gamma-glutamyltransferase [Jaaginema sp. PMC 1078.18]